MLLMICYNTTDYNNIPQVLRQQLPNPPPEGEATYIYFPYPYPTSRVINNTSFVGYASDKSKSIAAKNIRKIINKM